MEPNDIDSRRPRRDSRIWSGLFLLIIGVLLLGNNMGAPIPNWLITWPVLLIAIGLLIGIKSKFHNPGSLIMILIGGVFFLDENVPSMDLHNLLVPVILIGLGIIIIMRPKRNCDRRGRRWRPGYMDSRGRDFFNPEHPSPDQKVNATQTEDKGEYIDIQALFGGVKRNIQSKNFKGGEIVSFMGGAEINFMQADLQHPVVLEVNNVFGGTKLIIPSNWDVKNEINAVFGGVEDKRTYAENTPNPEKRIYLKGSCVFGGIEVTNY